MDTIGDLAVIGIPAILGLVGWALLRQRNAPPLLAGCAALLIALIAMTAIFAVTYLV